MIVISDTNTTYSCFYRPEGVIATILKNDKKKLQFIAPPYLLDKIEEHSPKTMGKNNLTKKQANKLLKKFTEHITFYNLEEIEKKNRTKATEIAKDIDPDDYLFIVLHFQRGYRIWTRDAKLVEGLKEKGYDICVTTQQLREKTYKKST